MMENNKNQQDSEEEEDYIGNIWGWKFSRIALIVILFFLIWIAIRYFQHKDQMETSLPKTEQIHE